MNAAPGRDGSREWLPDDEGTTDGTIHDWMMCSSAIKSMSANLFTTAMRAPQTSIGRVAPTTFARAS